MLTSAHKRAVLSAKHVRDQIQEKPPIELMIDIHEIGGVYMKQQTFPGLSSQDITELIPEIQIGPEA